MKDFGSPVGAVWGVQETVYCKYVRREMRTLTTEDKEAFFDVRAQPEQRRMVVQAGQVKADCPLRMSASS
jgi:hypothetical protein